MKLLAIFSAILAVSVASPASWTVQELSEAIQNPNTHVSLIPILEDALNELMAQIYAGSPVTTTTVSTVVQDFTSWTMYELSEAIQDPQTNPELLPYLEHALNTMISNVMAGHQQDYIIISTPVGLLPIEQAIVPVAPVDTPVVPAPVEAPVSAASPLVQIIVNIKNQQQVTPSPVVSVPEVSPAGPIPIIPRPEPVPSPVIPAPVVLPEPVLPVVVLPQPVVLPEPVLPSPVIPAPVVLPEPVLPVVVPNPVDIIAVNPGAQVNPIDVIAITAPEVNPVDILNPVPVVAPAGAVDIVGPLV